MKNRQLLAGLLIFFSLFLATFTFYFYQVFRTPNLQAEKEDRFLLIPTGATYRTVMDSLRKNDVVRDELSFSLLAKMVGYQDRVLPGRYLIRKDMNNRDAVRILQRGLQTPVRLTFNNIRLKEELVEKVARNLEMSPDTLLSRLNSRVAAGKYGFDTTTIMCMFLPNTYEVLWTVKPDNLLDRMSREYQKFWNETRRQRAAAIGFTPVEVSILASVVEAEQMRHNDEKPRVAGLYVNRLKAGTPLQADPTLIFALRDFSIRRVLKVHREVDSPYNTYARPGLPPGPINLPSLASLEAVLHYEKHDYVYMCAKEDFSGYHRFTNDFNQHLNNARLFQAALNKLNIRQ
ncbi:MAG: endolytic transglycosylase MltG [Ferruginibacter sp.]|nr:endolytic transglycosylase MltG [Cytophagales bacterium]